ncbi:MAG: hypothetical protein IJ558_13990 [Treponema sp.]|nr:hypothetical protein [Treponema sp.]MBR1405271.1 hypothetical protein [Treponema sp.]
MKIYYPYDNPEKVDTPYVRSLTQNIPNLDANVEFYWGLSDFWNDKCLDYDIIHIMFPHFLVMGRRHSSKDLEQRLNFLKSNGKIIVSTCHNFVPHYKKQKKQTQAYELVYKYSDEIYHLEEYSKTVFEKKYPDIPQKLLYHPIYTNAYMTSSLPSRNEAKEKLGLDRDKKYILCFGAFRDNEERLLILGIYDWLVKNDLYVLAPSFFRVKKTRNKIAYLYNLLKFRSLKKKFPHIIFSNSRVPENDVPLYAQACDIGLIQRIHILNSGNVFLYSLFGKIFVAPDEGNVGVICKKTGMPSFDAKDRNSLIKAISEALKLSENNAGEALKNYAIKNWSLEAFYTKQWEYYKEIVDKH